MEGGEAAQDVGNAFRRVLWNRTLSRKAMHTLIRSRRVVLGALAPLFLVAAVAPLVARAQPVQLKLTASDANARDRFGVSAAVSGDVAVVGAAYDDGRGVDSGSAYVFRRVGGAWVEEQKLTASDGASHDEFGHAVAVSGDVAVVGAEYDSDRGRASGSA